MFSSSSLFPDLAITCQSALKTPISKLESCTMILDTDCISPTTKTKSPLFTIDKKIPEEIPTYSKATYNSSIKDESSLDPMFFDSQIHVRPILQADSDPEECMFDLQNQPKKLNMRSLKKSQKTSENSIYARNDIRNFMKPVTVAYNHPYNFHSEAKEIIILSDDDVVEIENKQKNSNFYDNDLAYSLFGNKEESSVPSNCKAPQSPKSSPLKMVNLLEERDNSAFSAYFNQFPKNGNNKSSTPMATGNSSRSNTINSVSKSTSAKGKKSKQMSFNDGFKGKGKKRFGNNN